MRTPYYRRPTLLVSAAMILLTASCHSNTRFADAATALERPLQYHKDKHLVRLSDQTFEHQTQASTGQTTGNWLVWFYDTGDNTVIEGEMFDDDFRDQHNVVVATVHAGLARETTKRFQLSKDDVPCFLYFSRRKMYKYTGALSWEALAEFVQDPTVSSSSSSSGPLDVPPPRSEFVKMMEVLHAAKVTHMLAVALTIVIGLFVMYTRVVAQSMQHTKKKSN